MRVDDTPATDEINAAMLSAIVAAGAMHRTYEAGEKVFLEDDYGSSLFVVQSGRVDILTYGTVLENVAPSGFFGEMALVDTGTRSAAAIAAQPSALLEIDKAAFLKLISANPEFALTVMTRMAKRIRRMNSQI